ncbi:uncharacterized protein LOC144302350 [Canis aureus]
MYTLDKIRPGAMLPVVTGADAWSPEDPFSKNEEETHYFPQGPCTADSLNVNREACFQKLEQSPGKAEGTGLDTDFDSRMDVGEEQHRREQTTGLESKIHEGVSKTCPVFMHHPPWTSMEHMSQRP